MQVSFSDKENATVWLHDVPRDTKLKKKTHKDGTVEYVIGQTTIFAFQKKG